MSNPVTTQQSIDISVKAVDAKVWELTQLGTQFDAADMMAALRSALTARDERIAALERRMTDARRILTNGNPRPDCNWGLLDVTRDIKP